MPLSVRARLATAALLFSVAPVALQAQAAQASPPKKAEHGDHHAPGQKQGEDHAASGWKELDAYHALMMETWHPAKGKNDLAPIRAKAADMVASAQRLAASPAPKGCDTPAMKTASTKLVPATQGVADLVTKKADDATLKAALKSLHDSFETLESCKPAASHGKHH